VTGIDAAASRDNLQSLDTRSTPRILAIPKILSLQILFRVLFSVRCNWAPDCIARYAGQTHSANEAGLVAGRRSK
jgi:hypothetical protein